MQSAEEFVKNNGNWTFGCAPFDMAVNSLRARDREIVEACRKTMNNIGWIQPKVIDTALDSVLRDLG